MGSGRKLGLFALAAMTVCLAGSLRAAVSEGGLTIRTKIGKAPARIDLRLRSPKTADWEITVGFDDRRCEIYCSYRLKPDRWGRQRFTHWFLPPAAEIRVYTGDASVPLTVVVDPAGTLDPTATRAPVRTTDDTYLPGKSPLLAGLREGGSIAVSGPGGPAPSALVAPPSTSRQVFALRI